MEEQVYTLSEPSQLYDHKDLIYMENAFKIISCCIEVHQTLGRGFLEAVYNDALAQEFKTINIPFEREKKFETEYKSQKLQHFYCADFFLFGKIVLEVKAQKNIIGNHYKQVLNYLAISGSRLGLLVNFREDGLRFKRVVL